MLETPGARAPERRADARHGRRCARSSPTPTLSRSRSWKRTKSWKAAVTCPRHSPRSNRVRSTPSTRMAPSRRAVHAAQELDQRGLAGAVVSDKRDRPSGGKLERQRPKRGLVLAAGVREPKAVEHDPRAQARRHGDAPRVGHAQRALVVLEPQQLPRGTERGAEVAGGVGRAGDLGLSAAEQRHRHHHLAGADVAVGGAQHEHDDRRRPRPRRTPASRPPRGRRSRARPVPYGDGRVRRAPRDARPEHR